MAGFLSRLGGLVAPVAGAAGVGAALLSRRGGRSAPTEDGTARKNAFMESQAARQGRPMMSPQEMPNRGPISGSPGIQMGQAPGMPMDAAEIGPGVAAARRQFMMSRLQRNPTGGFNPGGY